MNIKINGIKLLATGMALLLGGFGTFILSIYSLLPLASYTGIIGVSAFIIGLGFTALASTMISINTGNENKPN
jgi:apolipoprotein N-acyltransferase